MGFELDAAELEGKAFRCLPDCAYCCLCPPEVSGKELEYFLHAHPSAVEDREGTPHIALQGGAGGCSLLSSRRCADYDQRPFHCRAFPLRIHFSYRVQCCANLSCRGMVGRDDGGAEGQPLAELLWSIVEESRPQIDTGAAAAARHWKAFIDKCQRKGFSADLAATRGLADGLIGRWPEELGADREEAAELIADTFGTKEPAELPVYIGPELGWWVFRVDRDRVRRYSLSEDGRLGTAGDRPLAAIPLLPMDSAGREAFQGYARLLNARDPVAASAALVVRLTGFEDEFEEAYLDTIRDCALDLWWRASLLATLKGAGNLGAAEIREGVVFCDADFLDMAGIGGML